MYFAEFPFGKTHQVRWSGYMVERPGQIIQNLLAKEGWSQADLAMVMGKPTQVVSDIIRGVRPVTPDTAVLLEAALPITAEELLRAETAYRLAQIRSAQSIGDEVRRRRDLANRFPLREAAKLGWIEGKTAAEREESLANLLGVESLLDYVPRSFEVSFRAKFQTESHTIASDIWVRQVEHIASNQEGLGPLNIEGLLQAIEPLLAEANGVSHVKSILRDLGIRVVYLPQIPGTKLDGALIRDNHGPIIALTLRFNRVDWFWFTLLHECGHLVHGHSGSRLDALDSDFANREEIEADRFAQGALIPSSAYRQFIDQADGFFTPAMVREFARRIRRHPGIITGRLQRDKWIPYSQMRSYLEPVESFLEGQISR
ncbi:MAG: hypothetical protein BGO01_20825 [Armatimonadetes bacterium 55-13]|nr:MAG: hypothetical protein BGO01_20825 [Armatimonadetes bacterium 55-13]